MARDEDEALRVADEDRKCIGCGRRVRHRIINFFRRDSITCTECGTNVEIFYKGKEETGRKITYKSRETPPEKKLGRPPQEQDE